MQEKERKGGAASHKLKMPRSSSTLRIRSKAPILLTLLTIFALSLNFMSSFGLSNYSLFQTSDRKNRQEHRTHVYVTRPKTDSRPEVYFSVLQALSRAGEAALEITLLDIPAAAQHTIHNDDKDFSSSFEQPALALKWQEAAKMKSSVDANGSYANFIKELGDEKSIILTTACAADLIERPELYTLLLQKTQMILYCIVDDARPFLTSTDSLSSSTIPWLERGRLHYIAHSEHVGQLLLDRFKDPLASPRVFPPIFNIADNILDGDEMEKERQLNRNNASMIIMEDTSLRSSTTMIESNVVNEALLRFATSRSLARKEKKRVVNAVIVGKIDKVQKPKDLADTNLIKVSDDGIIGILKVFVKSVIVVPISDKEERIAIQQFRASTVIPLAIIAGIPPLVDEETLAAHGYLDPDAAVVITSKDAERLYAKMQVQPGSEPLDMMRAFQYLAIPDFSQGNKRRAMETLRTTLQVQNSHKLQRWIALDTKH